MTDEELNDMERMWAAGVPTKVIASKLCYSSRTVMSLASHDRKRFPRRYAKTSKEDREKWVRRIDDGEVTIKQAMEALGVSRSTIAKWRSK